MIVAVVVTKEETELVSGDMPIFVAKDAQEKLELSTTISRTTKSMIHELPNGVHILIRH